MNRSTEPDFDPRIADWLEDDPNLAPSQALETVLAAYPSIPQRRPMRVPRRLTTMTMPLRLATAAVIGVLVLGGAYYLSRPGLPSVGTPGPTPTASASAGARHRRSLRPGVRPASMAEARTDFAAVLLPDGRVLALGGRSPGRTLATAEIYDPATGRWTSAG